MNVVIFNNNTENTNQLIKYIKPELNNFIHIKSLSIISNIKTLKKYLKKYKIDLLITDNLELKFLKLNKSTRIILISPEYINIKNSIFYTSLPQDNSNQLILDPITSMSIKLAINGLLISYKFNPFSEGTYLLRDSLYYALTHSEKIINNKSINRIYSFISEKYNISTNSITNSIKRSVIEIIDSISTSKASLLPFSKDNSPKEIISILLTTLSST